MISAEEVNLLEETAVFFVKIIGSIRSEIGVLTIAPPNHPIFIVSEVGGAHPNSSVFIKDVPLSPKSIYRRINFALSGSRINVVQGSLAKEDIKPDPKCLKGFLNLIKLLQIGILPCCSKRLLWFTAQ